ncbi:MAG: endonuclease/exonuclease/phosphatase family protein [Bacteroidota bacterium]
MRRTLWFLFALLDGLVLGLAAAGWAAAYVDPRVFWWPAPVAVGLPLFALALVGLTVLLVAQKRWGWAVLHGAALAVLAVRLVPLERLEARAAPAPGDLTVMTLNAPRYGDSAEQLTADVAALLAAEQPGLVALQEAGAEHARRPPYRPVIASYVQPAVDSLGYRLAIPPDWETELPLLVRLDAPGDFAVLEQSQEVLARGPEDEGASRYVRTHFRWQGREGVHYNLHLRSFGAAKPWDVRLDTVEAEMWLPFLERYRRAYQRRADEVEQVLASVEAETLPVLLSGDLNATPDNWTYRRLAEGRTDAFRLAGSGWGGTYRADRPLVRIDFVLAGPAWDVVAAHVPDVEFSDHRPVVARLRWREAE